MYEEVVRILEYIQMHATVEDQDGTVHNANIIWGTSEKPQLGNAIELVVVHELCHIRVKNHGPDFYALLEHYLPDYRERKRHLR